MTVFWILLLCLGGFDVVFSASIHRGGETNEIQKFEQIQNSEEVILATSETQNVDCFSEAVKIAVSSVNPQQNTEKVLDEIENIGDIVPESIPNLQPIQSQTIPFEETSKNITFSGILPKADVLQDEINMNNEIIGIGPDTKVETKPIGDQEGRKDEEEIGNEHENENESENTLLTAGKHEYDNLNFIDLLKDAVENTASQHHYEMGKEEQENDKLSWDVVEFLIMLAPTVDDKPIGWWRILVEAVQCSMRHCSIGGPKMQEVHLPKIIRRRRRAITPEKCKCQALENLLLQAEMLPKL